MRTFTSFTAWKTAVEEAGHGVPDNYGEGPQSDDAVSVTEAYTVVHDPDPQCGAPIGLWDPVKAEGILAEDADEYATWLHTCSEHDYVFSRSCGVAVCMLCNDHKGLARCFCGWSRSGGNGRQELVDMGEVIDEEDI